MNTDKSQGNSRAALKKRKRKEAKDVTSSSTGAGAGELFSAAAQRSAKTSKSAKKAAREAQIPIDQPEEQQEFLESLADFDYGSSSIIEVLELKEVVDINSQIRAGVLAQMLVQPMPYGIFQASVWGKEPSLFPHSSSTSSSSYLKGLFSKKKLMALISNQLMLEDVDVSFHMKDDRIVIPSDLPPSDEVIPGEEILNRLAECRCAIFPNIQKFNDDIWRFLSSLEHLHNSAVVANISYFPADKWMKSEAAKDKAESGLVGIDGSAEDLDDEDEDDESKGGSANVSGFFVIQLEGEVACKVEIIPTEPSLSDSGSGSGSSCGSASSKRAAAVSSAPALETCLKKGDVLYIPRGYKYSASNESKDKHALSLKIIFKDVCTVSNLLDILLPETLQAIATAGVKSVFSQPLPSNYSQLLGVSASENEDPARDTLQSFLRSALLKVADAAADYLDPAADQLTKRFMGEKLPVAISRLEEKRTAAGNPGAPIYPFTQLRMVRPGAAIVVVEDGKAVVYHCMDNSREVLTAPLRPLEFDLDDGPAIEGLLTAYPGAVTVSELDHPSDELEDKIGVAQALYKEGFLVIEDDATLPLDSSEGSDSDGDGHGGESIF